MMESLKRRFQAAYIIDDNSQCWIWKKHTDNQGYGKITFEKKSCYGHRISYFLKYGYFPNELLVCHHCDNRSCVNPAHLFLGTCADNVKDMIKKGRQKFPSKGCNSGIKNPHAKLNDQKVKEIKILIKKGLSCIKISQEYNVARQTISNIKRNSHWQHVVID